jgi:hypothetical protein
MTASTAGIVLGALALFGSSVANAASVTGSMSLGGTYTLDGGSDFVSAEGINLGSVVASADASGSLGSTVSLLTAGNVNTSPLTYDPFAPIVNLLDIGGWQIDLGTLNIDSRTGSALFLTGTGSVSGNGFDITPAAWSLSAQSTAGTYSMTVSAVPVPAAVWLFGSGLIGLVAAAKRKRG